MNRRTHKHTVGYFDLKKASGQRADALKIMMKLVKNHVKRVSRSKLDVVSPTNVQKQEKKRNIVNIVNENECKEQIVLVVLKNVVEEKSQTICEKFNQTIIWRKRFDCNSWQKKGLKQWDSVRRGCS